MVVCAATVIGFNEAVPGSPIDTGVGSAGGVPKVGAKVGTLRKSPRGSVNCKSTQPGPAAVDTRYQALLLLTPRTGSSVPPTTVSTTVYCGPSPLRTLRKLVLTTSRGIASWAICSAPDAKTNWFT